MGPTLPLGDVAFYWRMLDTPDDSGRVVPAMLPFSFAFDADSQLIIQQRNAQTLDSLQAVYLENENVGYLQEGHALSKSYGGEFLEFILRATERRSGSSLSLLEIGCGGGYLLKQLREKGFRVKGVDPSPVANRKAEELGIDYIERFYPTQMTMPKSDVIVHYDVLEHIADPLSFLTAHRGDLNPHGSIILAVPDCTDNIRLGDISMVLHEHLNYFDTESLSLLVQRAGFNVLSAERSQHGGVIFCMAELAQGPPLRDTGTSAERLGKFNSFAERVQAAQTSLHSYIGPLLQNPEASLGFYVPLRIIPYLSVIKMFKGFRFFDDDPGIHGKYFDGFQVPVEGFDDLVNNPVTHLVVASFSFAHVIEQKVRDRLGPPLEIRTLGNFM